MKLEAGGTGRGSANATPSRTSRSGSGSEDRQPSEPPIKREHRLDSIMSASSPSPATTPISPEEPFRSPATTTLDRHSAERSPTFSTSSRDLPSMQSHPHHGWDDQLIEHPSAQRHLPSLSDVFEGQQLMGTGRVNETNGYPFPRDHINNSPGPLPNLDDARPPPMLRHQDSSAASTSSGSSYGYPRTPIDGSLPIHALLVSKPGARFEPGQAQSYFQGAAEHKQSFMQQVTNGTGHAAPNGYPTGHTNPHSHPSPHQPNYGAPQQQNHQPPRKPNLDLDGMSALLQAGEIVNRRTN